MFAYIFNFAEAVLKTLKTGGKCFDSILPRKVELLILDSSLNIKKALKYLPMIDEKDYQNPFLLDFFPINYGNEHNFNDFYLSSRVSSVAVRRGCTLTLYKNGNLVDMIMEIQVSCTFNLDIHDTSACLFFFSYNPYPSLSKAAIGHGQPSVYETNPGPRVQL